MRKRTKSMWFSRISFAFCLCTTHAMKRSLLFIITADCCRSSACAHEPTGAVLQSTVGIPAWPLEERPSTRPDPPLRFLAICTRQENLSRKARRGARDLHFSNTGEWIRVWLTSPKAQNFVPISLLVNG